MVWSGEPQLYGENGMHGENGMESCMAWLDLFVLNFKIAIPQFLIVSHVKVSLFESIYLLTKETLHGLGSIKLATSLLYPVRMASFLPSSSGRILFKKESHWCWSAISED